MLQGGDGPSGQDGKPAEPEAAAGAGVGEVAAQVHRAQVVGDSETADIGKGRFAADGPGPDRQRPQRRLRCFGGPRGAPGGGGGARWGGPARASAPAGGLGGWWAGSRSVPISVPAIAAPRRG